MMSIYNSIIFYYSFSFKYKTRAKPLWNVIIQKNQLLKYECEQIHLDMSNIKK